MNFYQKIIFATLSVFLMIAACSTPEEECVKPGSKKKVGKYHMRQDSELTTLMKEMEDDFKRMKADIAAGKPAKPGLDYQKILTAHGTEAEEVPSESYQAFAKNFLQTMEAFEKADLEKSGQLYENLVTSCMNCHTVHCPGPKVRIEKLY